MAPKKKSARASTGKKTKKLAIKIVRTKKVVAKAVRRTRVTKPAKTEASSKSSISRNRESISRSQKAHQRLKSLEHARNTGTKFIVETGQAPDVIYDSWETDLKEFDAISDAEEEAKNRDNDPWKAVRASLSQEEAKEVLDRPLTGEQWEDLGPHVVKLLERPRHSKSHPPNLPIWVSYSYLGYLRKIQRTQKASLEALEWLSRVSFENKCCLNRHRGSDET